MKYQRKGQVFFLRGFFFGFGGLNATFIAASKTVFTFCKQNKERILTISSMYFTSQFGFRDHRFLTCMIKWNTEKQKCNLYAP